MNRTPDQNHDPIATFRGAPVYRTGQAPDRLCTVRQLRAQRRKVLDDQQPAAWLNCRMPYRGAEYVPLYDPADSIRMPPLTPAQQQAVTARRTCQACGSTFPHPVRERHVPSRGEVARWCRRCFDADHELHLRTCARCRTVFDQYDSVRHGYRTCLPCSEHLAQARLVVRALTDRACPRCTVATATAQEVATARAGGGWWDPRTCAPCQEEERAERETARLRDLWRRWAEIEPVRDWARHLLADPSTAAILDTETTGLHDEARIVEIAVYTTAGEQLLDTLVNPREPIPAEASAIHGITDQDVIDAPTFGELLPALTEALAGRRIVIYNRAYDVPRLRYELERWHREMAPHEAEQTGDVHPAAAAWIGAQRWEECAMEQYAVHHGDWHPYWGNYTWQKLGGGHRAGGDCLAVVARLQEMAATPDPA